MDIFSILETAKNLNASDIHITVGLPPIGRTSKGLVHLTEEKLTSDITEDIALKLLTEKQLKEFNEKGEVDFSFGGAKIGRFRANVFKQCDNVTLALRAINSIIPTMEELKLPEVIKTLAHKQRGLILVTGPTGSGKSTTLASMINYINKTRDEHIITIEDPIEYTHKHEKSIVNQREIGTDTKSFANALRASLRQDPDIILVGEMRDLETISTAITAAETGHLVLSTLHTIGSAKTIDRIIDVFPPHQQQQVRTQLATVLQAVISQQLLPLHDKSGRVGAFEIMISTPAINNLIREGKTHQINTIIQTNKQLGMHLMDSYLKELFSKRLIDVETLKKYAVDFNSLSAQLGM